MLSINIGTKPTRTRTLSCVYSTYNFQSLNSQHTQTDPRDMDAFQDVHPSLLWNMAIDMVDLPIKNGVFL